MKRIFIIPAACLLLTACGTEGSRQTSAPAAQTTTAPAETAAQPADTTESVTAEAETAAPAESTVEYRVALNHMMRGIDAEPAAALLQMIEGCTVLEQQPAKQYDANFYFGSFSGEGHDYHLQLTDQGWVFMQDEETALGVTEEIRNRATLLVNQAVGDNCPQTASADMPQLTFHCDPMPVGTGILYATVDQTGLPYDAVKCVSLTDSSGNALYIDTLDGGSYLGDWADLYGAPTVVLLVDPAVMPAGDYTVMINGSTASVSLLPEQDYINLKNNG